MVIINYKLSGKKNEKCNFLDIPEMERKKLVKMINKVKEFDKDIEVNIVKLDQLKYEVDNDHRIRAKFSNESIAFLCSGKRFLPEELNFPLKNEKICYCCHNRNFDDTTLTVFHELNHFRDPFDLGIYYQQFEIDQTNIPLETCLKFNIEAALNEFYADYRVVKQLALNKNLKERLLDQAKGYLRRSFTMVTIHPHYLSDFNKITQMFNDGFKRIFHFLGFWKGFYEIGETSKLEEMWDQFILNFHYDLINPNIFNSIKLVMFKNQKDTVSIIEIFKHFFNQVFNLKF